MVRGRTSDWVVHPVFEAARPCPRPEDGTSEDPTAEDCTPEDCTCEGCTAQVCPPEACTSKDNTSEDRSAEDRTADVAERSKGPTGSPRRLADPGSNPRHGSFFCPHGLGTTEKAEAAVRPWFEGGSRTGSCTPFSRRHARVRALKTAQAKTPLLKTALPKTAPAWAARLKSAPRKPAPAKTTPLKTAPLKMAPLTWPSGQRDRPEVRGGWRTRVQTRGIAAFSAQMV
jgi:hypothetical protein